MTQTIKRQMQCPRDACAGQVRFEQLSGELHCLNCGRQFEIKDGHVVEVTARLDTRLRR